ncbi:acetate uptake transporter [Pseudonocardia sp. RS11V-5]|uniref:acetate uptake transporter n=1 Tax=Pseudonocardia terrae TaxID=2905831 RepID=UPI001E5B98D1|nr:acetate uptake transporter [Pseudonocardia terrae]MCE3554707.1 acetate uptake transporter [Pseudonocardia terrae]
MRAGHRTTDPLRAGQGGDPATPGNPSDGMVGKEVWEDRSRIVLTPVAAPSVLGLFGFATATLMVATLLAGWWGTPATAAPVIAPFALFFGGLGQLLAGMWSYRARDTLATAMHGTWGTFWLAWGSLVLLGQTGLVPAGAVDSRAFGFWFIGLSVVTLFGTIAAMTESVGLFTVLGLLTAGSVLLAIGLIAPLAWAVVAGGWVLVFSAGSAFYVAGAMLLAATSGRTILPMGKLDAASNIPGRRPNDPVEYSGGMPGARVGQ